MSNTINSSDWFALDGISCETIGLYCDTPPVQVMAERRGTTYKVGTDEDIYADDNSFSDITFRFSAYAFFPNDFDTSAVYSFLQGKKKLTMSRNDGYYYRIRTITCNPTERADGNRIKYAISIKCAPFRYIDNEPDVVLTSSGIVVNNGTRYCKPVYTVTLSNTYGTGNLTVNNQTVTITVLSSYAIANRKIIIDAEKEMAYGTTGTNLTMFTSGIYRYLVPGNNVVAFGGICQSVSVKRNGRCY